MVAPSIHHDDLLPSYPKPVTLLVFLSSSSLPGSCCWFLALTGHGSASNSGLTGGQSGLPVQYATPSSANAGQASARPPSQKLFASPCTILLSHTSKPPPPYIYYLFGCISRSLSPLQRFGLFIGRPFFNLHSFRHSTTSRTSRPGSRPSDYFVPTAVPDPFE